MVPAVNHVHWRKTQQPLIPNETECNSPVLSWCVMMRVHTSAEHWVRALSAPRPREADFRVGRTSKALTLPLRYPLFHVHAAFQFIPLFPLTWAGFSFGVPRPHPSLAKAWCPSFASSSGVLTVGVASHCRLFWITAKPGSKHPDTNTN